MSKREPRRSGTDQTSAEVIPLYPKSRELGRRTRLTKEQAHEPLVLTVDGERVVVEASEELVLRCGAASITLRSNGRVLIQGTHLETSSEGVNRIKGGSVQIN